MHPIPTNVNGTASVNPCTSKQDSAHKYCKYIGSWINSTKINHLWHYCFFLLCVNVGLSFRRTQDATSETRGNQAKIRPPRFSMGVEGRHLTAERRHPL